METFKRTEIHVNNRCVEILSNEDYIPSLNEVFELNYTISGVLRTDTLKVVSIEDDIKISEASRFLPRTKRVVTKINCQVEKNHYKQRFSSY